MNGKGDRSRPVDNRVFHRNYDLIRWEPSFNIKVLDLIEAVEVICDEDGFGLDRAREIAAKLKMEIKGG